MTVKGWTYDFEKDGIYYNLLSPGVEVTYGSPNFNSYSGEVTIPQTVVRGDIYYSVNSISDNAFRDCTQLISISIGSNVSSIGNHAFSGCKALKYFSVSSGNSQYSSKEGVLFAFNETWLYAYPPNAKSTSYVIPDGVETISSYAFEGCTYLTSITTPNSLERIDQIYFAGCLGLKEFIISDDNPLFSTMDGVLFNKDKTELVAYPNAKSKTYSIPNSVTNIKYNTFYGCDNLTSVTIPNSVVSIGKYAFYGCNGLLSIEIPSSVTTIDPQSFKYCTHLKEFIVSDNNKSFSTLDGLLCNKEKTKLLAYLNAKSSVYTVPDQIISIGNYAFSDCTELTSITIPNNVIEIGNSIFSGCRNLQKLSLPFIGSSPNLRHHLGSLFESKNSYKTINPEQGYIIVTYGRDGSWIYSYYIPSSLTEINVTKQSDFSCRYGGYNYWYYGVFNGCSNLKVANLPMATSIGDNTFFGCTNLKNISLPIATSIDKNAFSNCTNLKSVDLPVATSIGEESFYGCTNLKNVNLSLVDFIGKYAFQNCSNLEVLSLPVATSTESGFLNNCDKLQILLLPKVKSMETWSFPKSLISLNIGSLEGLSSEMLSNLSKLEELTIPFVGTGVKETATGVQGLFGDLFSADSNSGMKAVTQYYQDSKSKTYYLPVNLKKVTVTEECEELQYGAFYGCSTIKEITLPYTLYMVGEKALYGCAGLTDIYCKGAAPAAAYDNSFTGIRVTTCKLHIPYNTTDLYKASDGWKKFFYMQEEAPLTVNVTKNILNAGIILGITEYQQGAMVNLSARANSGYRFKCWMDNGEIVSEEDNYSFTINENKNLLAVFIPVQNENSLIINTESNAVNFTWETIDDTNEYILKIYSDIDMKKEIASYQFDAEGELVTRTASELSFRVTDLKPEVTYYYSLIANDKSNKTLSEQIGTFSTTPTGIEDISTSSNICIRVEGSSLWIENAQEKMISIYNLQGVCQTVIHKAKDMEMIQIDHSGIYLIKVDKLLQKVIIK